MVKYLVIMVLFLISLNFAKKITFMNTQRPTVTYYDKNVFKCLELKCSRRSRTDPIYYCSIDVHLLVPYDNNMIMELVHYEKLGQAFKLSFVRLKFQGCEFFFLNPYLPVLQARLKAMNITCPVAPGHYLLTNLTASNENLPINVPHTKGRGYINITSRKTKKSVMTGYLDFEILQIPIKEKH